MSWKLSVASKVPRFNIGYNFATTLNVDITSGAVAASVNSDAIYRLLPGDIVKIGPSTTVGSEGLFEFGKVASISGSNITFDANLTYDYKSGDSLTGVGSASAEGWDVFNNLDVPTSIRFRGISVKDDADGLIQKGYLNNFGAQYIEKDTGASSGSLHYHTDLKESLLRNVTYRLGAYMKNSNVTLNSCLLILFNAHTTLGADTIISIDTANSYSSYTKVEGTGAETSDPLQTFARISIFFDTTSFFDYWATDFVYLTHASMTDGSGAGVYTFPENPDNVNRADKTRTTDIKALQNYFIDIGGLDETNIKTYRLRFNRGSKSFLKNLQILQYFQNLGSALMLESDVATEKPIIGFMDFKWRYDFWDLTQPSIDLIFTGI